MPQIIQQKPTALRLKVLKKNTGALKNDVVAPNKQYQLLTPTATNSKNKRQTCPLNLAKIDSPTTQLVNGQKNQDFLCSLDLQTPTGPKDSKENNDDEMQLEIDDDSQSRSKSGGRSSGSSSGDQIGSEESDADQDEQLTQVKDKKN